MAGECYGELVSVIVPVYNVEPYLRRCLDSLAAQIYRPREIILIDDGSGDGSGQICDEYADKYSDFQVIHKENGGVSSARNLGIQLSKGKYLVFVDSDDCVHPELLEIYMRSADRNQVSVCGVAASESQLQCSCLGMWNDCVKKYERKRFMQFLYDDHVAVPWNKLYDGEIIRSRQLQFDVTKNLGEDFLFNLAYLSCAPQDYQVIDCPLYFYQENRAGSLENSYRKELFDLQILMFHTLEKFLMECDTWQTENQNMYFRLYWERLYLTLRIYKKHQKISRDEETREVIKKAVNSAEWRRIGRECRKRHLMNWKMRLKNLEVQRLKWTGRIFR